MRACIHPEGEVHTPYGATEALPVASISASEVLGQNKKGTGTSQMPLLAGKYKNCSEPVPCFFTGTAAQTRLGRGVCVGRRFPGVRWGVVQVVDGPISTLDETRELPRGEIGELIVHGPMTTRRYVTRVEANALAKITDGEDIWHRMGDCGYLDVQDRFWFCGRVAHRVLTSAGPMYPVCCEAIINCHPAVRRVALVGVGPLGSQRPVFVVEPLPGKMPRGRRRREEFFAELRALAAANPLTQAVEDFLLHPSFPVDIRHNAKIFREKLAVWAAKRIAAIR
jgi:acyl-CoA synthetase (AMP-forming)/AMP-acid ligase II